MPRELGDSVVVITGASSGIGRATAHALAERGASVVLAARSEQSLREALADVEGIDVCTILPASVDTPIFRHAANYAKYAGKPVPPIADPDRAVKAILRCIEHPRREVTVGQFGHLEAVIQEILSGPFNWLAPHVMNRAAFGSEPSEVGPGNVFEPMPEWNQVTGGWRRKRKEVLGRAALAGGAALAPLLAYWLIRRRG